MRVVREVEAAFEVPSDAALPELTGIPGLAAVRSQAPVTLVAQYWDTADLALLAAGVTLRRRTGGTDDGWHLKLPDPDPTDPHSGSRRRDEHRSDLAGERPPAELVVLVRSRLHGRPVVPVARVTTTRTVHHLLDPDGREAVEIADDRVVGQVLGAARSPDGRREDRWHEWEAELKDGELDQLAGVLALLAAAAGTGPRAAGKLARTFGELVPVPVATEPRDGTAGEVVRAYLARWTQALLAAVPAVLAGDEDAVHDARSATRRLRAALGPPVLDAPTAAAARAGLRDLGRLLGAARDPQVEIRGLRALAAAEGDPDDAAVRALLDLIVTDRDRAHHEGSVLVAAWLASTASDETFAALSDLAEHDAAGPEAQLPALQVLGRATRRAHRAAADAWDAVSRSAPSAHDVALHAARRAARQARYTAAVAALAVGRPASRSATRYQRLQDTLGDQHDSVLRRATLARLRPDDPAQAFVAGRWHAQAQAAGERAERDAVHAARRAFARRHRRWMRR